MDKQMKDTFCKLIDTELDKMSKLQALNDVSLQNLWRLTDTKKNLLKIEKLENEVNYGNSYGYDRDMDNGYSRRYPIYGGDSYNGYSMTGRGGESYNHLEEAMNHATSEAEKEAIRQLMVRFYNR